jgi:methionine-rich copper-binding protein CopC
MKKHFASFVALVAVVVLAFAAGLSAHMKLEKTLPAADSTVTASPSSVQVWFSEAPDAKVSKVTITGPSGPVKITDVHVMDKTSLMAMVGGTMPDGRYTVAWQAAGDDGHLQKGQFVFNVKSAK